MAGSAGRVPAPETQTLGQASVWGERPRDHMWVCRGLLDIQVERSGGCPGLEPRARERGCSRQLARVREKVGREEEAGWWLPLRVPPRPRGVLFPRWVSEPASQSVLGTHIRCLHRARRPRGLQMPYHQLCTATLQGHGRPPNRCGSSRDHAQGSHPTESTLPPAPPCPQGWPEEGPRWGGQGPLCPLPLSSPVWWRLPALRPVPTLR